MTSGLKYLVIAIVLAAALPVLKTAQRVDLADAFALVRAAHAAEEGNFDNLAPEYHKANNTVTFDGKTYVSDARAMLDKDGNGVKETKLERYNAGPHQKILRYETRGIIWAWAVYKNYDDRLDASNYVIVDFGGKDGFDTKLKTDEPFGLPDYLKDPGAQH